MADDDDEDTDDYECSECLSMYQQEIEAGNGAAWVKCRCGHWITMSVLTNHSLERTGSVVIVLYGCINMHS